MAGSSRRVEKSAENDAYGETENLLYAPSIAYNFCKKSEIKTLNAFFSKTHFRKRRGWLKKSIQPIAFIFANLIIHNNGSVGY